MAMSPFTAQALLKALGGGAQPAGTGGGYNIPVDPSQPWNPAAGLATPNWQSGGGGKGGAKATAQPTSYGPGSVMADGPAGNGIARGAGITQEQIDAANKDNPYSRDAADIEEGIYGGDRSKVQAYAGSIAGNQAVPQDVQDAIDRLRKAKVYSPVDLSGYGNG